jgi:hypothetical protein
MTAGPLGTFGTGQFEMFKNLLAEWSPVAQRRVCRTPLPRAYCSFTGTILNERSGSRPAGLDPIEVFREDQNAAERLVSAPERASVDAPAGHREGRTQKAQ